MNDCNFLLAVELRIQYLEKNVNTIFSIDKPKVNAWHGTSALDNYFKRMNTTYYNPKTKMKCY